MILTTFLATTALITGSIWIMQTPLLHVASLTAEGTAGCGEEELIETSGLTLEDNMLVVMFSGYARARERILLRYSFLQEVSFRYRPDRSVRIIATERTPVARVVREDRKYLLDDAWVLFEIPVMDEASSLLLLTGLSFAGENLPEDLKKPDNMSRRDVYKRLTTEIIEVDLARETNLLTEITGIDLTNPGQPKITVADRIILDLGGMEDLDLKIPLFMEAFRGNLKTQRGTFTFTDSRTGHFIPE